MPVDECYLAEVNWFRSRTWHACVLDEGHKIKSSETLISQALQPVRSQHRLILTGTPLQNNLVELWSILHWLYPKVFTDQTRRPFEEAFDLSKGTYDQEFLKAARKLLELVMLRRTKEGVKTQLSVPPREEITREPSLPRLDRQTDVRCASIRPALRLSTLLDKTSAHETRRRCSQVRVPALLASTVFAVDPFDTQLQGHL